ncbi:hypothetical protein NDU88_005842 [Pleurodeles waltl]|uniref:Uncharacterized protein n=1 Tax=Pleurodeles waltl TaxID=8319 RepID=A0AAV7MXH1_PLEWA|nr:hypothetical protein NDU88_005842 [Pleurodeles waltl]
MPSASARRGEASGRRLLQKPTQLLGEEWQRTLLHIWKVAHAVSSLPDGALSRTQLPDLDSGEKPKRAKSSEPRPTEC